MASLIDRSGSEKVDLIVRDQDAWGDQAMQRRQRWTHPAWGSVWVSTLEDLVLAKLEWSAGISELQVRDRRMLIRMNDASIDRGYLARWSRDLGVEDLLAGIDEGGADAT